jgi:hypothetical protein
LLSTNRNSNSVRGQEESVRFQENSFHRRAFCRWRIVVRGLLRVYSQNLMDTKLLVWVLVLLLSGADPGAVLICAASCISSATAAGTVVHHHEMESQPTATHTSRHAHHHHGAPCVECPAKAGNSLNQKSDCDSRSEIEALRESAFSLDAPIGAAHVLFKRSPADSLALGADGQQSFLFADSLTGRSSGPPLLPLRI